MYARETIGIIDNCPVATNMRVNVFDRLSVDAIKSYDLA